jgi:hypothetical protein
MVLASLAAPPFLSAGALGGNAQAGTRSQLFSPDSIWNHRLRSKAPLSPRSDAMIGNLVREVDAEEVLGIGPWIQTSSFSTPLYVAKRGQRWVHVALDDPRKPWRRSLQRAFRRVPIPRHAQPAAGSDGHMTVWQPSTDKLWEFWRARKRDGRWHASWGGAFKHVSRSMGWYTRRSWPPLSHHDWGATASSLPAIGGTMLLHELRLGSIHHALAMAIPGPRANIYSWPAQRTDGWGPPGAIPEGARLRLPAHLNLRTRHLQGVTLLMARAAKRYGIIVRDQSPVVGFFAEDPIGASVDPYYGPSGLFAGRVPTRFLSSFPWKRLEVLRTYLCSNPSRPCLRR